MKVLKIYDHLGVLQLERNVFVEGEDFKYEASYPICVWLGSIVLEEFVKELEEPVEVEPEPVEPEPEPLTTEETEEEIIEDSLGREYSVQVPKEVEGELKKPVKKRKRSKRASTSNSS